MYLWFGAGSPTPSLPILNPSSQYDVGASVTYGA